MLDCLFSALLDLQLPISIWPRYAFPCSITRLPNYQISTKSLLMLWPYITLASAAAASYAGYATMAPASQLYGRTLTHGSDPSQMALTFDDGPNDPHTLHLLDVLAKHNAKATFFLIGKYVAAPGYCPRHCGRRA